jgi:hypothetical protein
MVYAKGNPAVFSDPMGLDPGYWGRYSAFVNQYLVNPTPYALPLLVGTPIPKSFVGASPLLGSNNPLTSVARVISAPGATSQICRRAVIPAIGVAVTGIGIYNAGILVNGLVQAIGP